MQLIRGLHNIKQGHRGCVATIGNFDGVHRGHKAILAALEKEAQRYNTKTCVITFEPSPREHFDSEQAPARLSSLREKLFLLERNGVDQLLCLPFDKHLSNITAIEFVRLILVEGLGIKYLIVGDDFRFGRGRTGCFSHLENLGKQFGFEVCDTRTITSDKNRISSTRIRNELAADQLTLANQLLGYPFTIINRVRKGQQLGQQLGFPTANLRIGQRKLPIKGVFAVRVYCDGKSYAAVANLGNRPTVNGSKPLLEVHLLNYKSNLYGHELRVEFIKKLRNEQKFESLDALKSAIARDVEQTQSLSERILAYHL